MDGHNGCLTKKDINHWCSVLGVSCKELVNMTDEEFEQKLATTHNRINNQSRESCSQWCDEFVNDYEGITDCQKNAKNEQIWTILQRAADDIAKGSNGCNRASDSSAKLLDEIRAILAKSGVEACTQTNDSLEMLSTMENTGDLCNNPGHHEFSHGSHEFSQGSHEPVCNPLIPVPETVFDKTHETIRALLDTLEEDQKMFEKSEQNYENNLRQSRTRSRSHQCGKVKRKCNAECDTERKSKSTERTRCLTDMIEKDACAVMRDLHRVLRNSNILEKRSK